MTGHSGAVIAVSGITLDKHGDSRTIVATSSADSTVRIWSRTEDQGAGITMSLKLFIIFTIYLKYIAELFLEDSGHLSTERAVNFCTVHVRVQFIFARSSH